MPSMIFDPNLGLTFPDGSALSSAVQLGMRNLLINANAAINQRAYVSGAATGAANQYTVDRWRVVVPGQGLAFAASGNGNVMTAPAGGLEQVIEGANIGITAGVIKRTTNGQAINFTNTVDSNFSIQLYSLITLLQNSVDAASIKIRVGIVDRVVVNNTGLAVTGALTATGAITGANLSGTNTGDQNLFGLVPRTSSTGSAVVPSGTTAQRDAAPTAGYFRWNQTTAAFEGYSGAAWGSVGGGATGAGGDAIFTENDVVLTTPYTIGQGAMILGASISIATPAVVALANTFVAGQPVRLTTTGALPTGLVINTVYYVSATGLSTASFQLSATSGGALIATSGTQSGVHSLGKVKNAEFTGPLTITATLTVVGGRVVML